MNDYPWNQTLVEKDVNYILEVDGKLVIAENVPAKVNLETGEQLLSANTLQRLREMIRERQSPTRVIETPVYEYLG
jgi:hypothetical protein